MKRQVIKFDDIEGMLAEDELRGIVGGCAWWNGSSWSGDGSSGGYSGGDLGTVTVGGTSGSGNSPGPSGYPNGYPNTGWTTGSGNGANGGGGSTDTTTNPQTQLAFFVNDHYPSFMTNHPNVIIRTGTTPEGYTVNANGQFVRNSDGEIAYGITHKSGDLTFVDISPNIMASVTGERMNTLIGHELLHAEHIEQYSDMYNNDRRQFNLNSELAAYTYQYNIAVNNASISFGNSELQQAYQAQADQMLGFINSYIAQGATGGFTTSIQ